MPTYVYQSKKTEKQWEVTQSIKEKSYTHVKVENDVPSFWFLEDIDELDMSDYEEVNRVPQAFGMQFNGTGFYVTDYKNKQSQ